MPDELNNNHSLIIYFTNYITLDIGYIKLVIINNEMTNEEIVTI